MIPRDYISEWRERAPWSEDFQVEQDLVISRALVAIYSDPVLAEALAFRGGTCRCRSKTPRICRSKGPHPGTGFDRDPERSCSDERAPGVCSTVSIGPGVRGCSGWRSYW